MNAYDETRMLRRRLQDLQQDLASDPQGGNRNSPTLIGQTTTAVTYPTTAQTYYAMFPVRITGQVAEGMAPSLGVGTTYFYALNLGSQIPPSGTNVLVNGIGGRFTFVYDG